jgi:hypothetical protein
MSSVAVRKGMRSRTGRRTTSGRWFTEGSAPKASEPNGDDAWLEVADSHLDLPSEAILAAIAKRRLRPVSGDNSDLLAGYVDEETDVDVVEAVNSAALQWDD